LKPIYIAIAAAAIFLVALGLWWLVFSRHIHSMDSLVTDSAVLVLEIKQANKITSQDGILPASVLQTSMFQRSLTSWKNLLKLASEAGADTTQIASSPIWLSLHTGNENKPEWICYLPEQELKLGDQVFENLKIQKFRYSTRKYLGVEVWEWFPENQSQGEGFAITHVQNTWVLSHSGYLLDEVIRTQQSMRWKPGMVGQVKALEELQSEPSKTLYWYANLRLLPEWAGYFFKAKFTPFFAGFHQAGYLGGYFENSGKDLHLTGFSTEKQKQPTSLPVSAAWPSVAAQNHLLTFKTTFLAERLNTLAFPNFQKAWAADPSTISIQFAIVDNIQKNEKLLTLTGQAVPSLHEDLSLAHKEGSKQDSLSTEIYNNHTILQLPQATWNLLAAENKLGSMSPCFAMLSGNEILFSSNILLLRNWLDRMQSANTHRPDPAANTELHLHFRMREGLLLFQEQLLANQLKSFNQEQPFFKNWQNLEIKVQHQHFQLQLSARKSTSDTISIENLAHVSMKSRVTKFWPYPSIPGMEQLNWVVCQLENNELHRLGPKGEMLWQASLPEQISTNIEVLDLSGKGNFGLLMATGKQFECRNELGASLQGFPKILPDTVPIELVSAWDYDKNKTYRLVAVSRYGDVFASGITDGWLPGWSPLACGDKLTMPPQHFRVANKDYIFIALQSGKIELRNRKGDMQPGFPIELKNRLLDDFLLEPGTQPAQAYIYVLTQFGEVIKFNLEGEKISTQQLYRPERETSFRFCLDQSKTTFCPIRQIPGKLTVFDQNYRTLFDFQTENGQYLVQYFRFGSLGKVFSITNASKMETYLVDESGKLLHKLPLPGSLKTNFFPVEENSVFHFATAKDSTVHFFKMTLP